MAVSCVPPEAAALAGSPSTALSDSHDTRRLPGQPGPSGCDRWNPDPHATARFRGKSQTHQSPRGCTRIPMTGLKAPANLARKS